MLKSEISTFILILFFLFSSIFPPFSAQSTDILNDSFNTGNEWKSDTAEINELIRKAIPLCASDYTQAMHLLQNAISKSMKIGYERGVGDSYLYYGTAFFYMDDRKVAIEYYEKARVIYEHISALDGMANYYSFLARTYNLHSENYVAVELYQKSLEIREELGDELGISGCYNGLAKLHVAQMNLDLAMEYAEQALAIKRELKHKIGEASVLCTIGEIYKNEGDYSKALEIFEQSLSIRREVGYNRHIASSLLYLSEINLQQNKPEKAIEYLSEGREIFELLKEKTGLIYVFQMLSEAQLLLGNSNEALQHARKALIISREIPNLGLIYETYDRMIQVFSFEKKFDSAFIYQKKYQTARDSLFGIEKDKAIAELEFKFQNDQKQHLIEDLNQKSKFQKTTLIIQGALILVLLVSAFSLFQNFYQKSTLLEKNKSLIEKERIIHEQDLTIKEKQSKILEQQLETRNRELTSKVLSIQKTNESIESLSSRLNEFAQKLNGNPRHFSEINSISGELERLAQNDLWNEFNEVFKSVHNEFYDKLLLKNPDLSPTEIKTAALLKMNLSTKDIAALTFKSESGIKSARYRLRKKLSLSSEESLVTFLMKL